MGRDIVVAAVALAVANADVAIENVASTGSTKVTAYLHTHTAPGRGTHGGGLSQTVDTTASVDVNVALMQQPAPRCWDVPTWAAVAIVPPQRAGDCGPSMTAAQTAASRRTGVPIVASCGQRGVLMTDSEGHVLHSAGDLASTDAAPRNTSITVALAGVLRGSNMTVGILLTSQLWDPLFPRELMLHGAELIVALKDSAGEEVPRSGGASANSKDARGIPTRRPASLPTDVSDAMLLARGFENAAAVLRVQSGSAGASGSAMANWCNDMLAPGCANGSMLLPLRLGDSGVERVSFSLDALRTQRASTIWGDAFRRPFTYQPLCFRSRADNDNVKEAMVNTEQDDPFNVTVAMLQMTACSNVSGCLLELETRVREAAAAGADVALTPEMWSMGYAAQWRGGSVTRDNAQELRSAFAWTGLAESLDGPYLTRVAELAKELGIAVAAGMMRRDEGDVGVATSDASLWPPHNSVVLVDRFGETVYIYDKVHTCDWSTEESLTTPGRQWRTGILRTQGGSVTVGSMICADREFPESARTLARNGAELILTPNACGLVDAQLNQFRTRAAENVAAVAMANYANMNGRSVAYDHEGSLIAGPASSDPGVITATFDIAALRRARASPSGQARLQHLTTGSDRLALCELHRRPEYQRQNAYGRVAGPAV